LAQGVEYRRAAFRKQPLVLKPGQTHEVAADVSRVFRNWLPQGEPRTYRLIWRDALRVGTKGNFRLVRLASNAVTVSMHPGTANVTGKAPPGGAIRHSTTVKRLRAAMLGIPICAAVCEATGDARPASEGDADVVQEFRVLDVFAGYNLPPHVRILHSSHVLRGMSEAPKKGDRVICVVRPRFDGVEGARLVMPDSTATWAAAAGLAAERRRLDAEHIGQRIEQIEKQLDRFQVILQYHGKQDKTYANLHLHGKGVKVRLRAGWTKAALDESQAKKLIDHLAAEGFLLRSLDVSGKDIKSPTGPAYTLTVSGPKGVELYEVLGWDPSLVARLKAMQKVLEGDAAKKMAELLKELEKADLLRAEAKTLVARLSNSDIIWDGDWIGILVKRKSKVAQSVLDLGDEATEELVKALDDKDRFAAAHVLLTLIHEVQHKRTAGMWNGLKVRLHADGRQEVFPEQIPNLKALWSKKGLRSHDMTLKLSVPKRQYAPGEDMVAELTFTNGGKQEWFFDKWNDNIDRIGHRGNVRFTVLNEQKERMKYIHSGQEDALAVAFQRRRIKPGESVKLKVTLNKWYDIAKPGKYTIAATYTSKGPFKVGEDLPMWEGALKSNEIEITVGKAIDPGKNRIQFEAHKADKVKPGLFAIGKIKASGKISTKKLFALRQTGEIPAGHHELVGRLSGYVPAFNGKGGSRLLLQSYKRNGEKIVIRIKYVYPQSRGDHVSSAVYLRAALPQDLPPGKYRVTIRFGRYRANNDGRLILMPGRKPPFDTLICEFEVPARDNDEKKLLGAKGGARGQAAFRKQPRKAASPLDIALPFL